jgi:hypothetical protein
VSNIIPFNPLDKRNLGASVAEALLTTDIAPLSEVPSFDGAGIYAIYYSGNFESYANLARFNKSQIPLWPIYVGKAIPPGGRIGGNLDAPAKKVLSKRLKEHSESIKLAENLDLADFSYRFLVVDDIWIPLGEQLIISRFTPVWNSVIDGFGNHNPGKGRHAGAASRWDVLHPGRPWVKSLVQRSESVQDIARDAEVFLRNIPQSLSTQFIEGDMK